MQITFSTKSIHGLNRIGISLDSISGKNTYGITPDAETFYPRNALENFGIREFDTDTARSRFAELIRDCAKSQILLHGMRAPHLKWDTKRTDLNDLMLQIGKECIAACDRTDCSYIVIQPIFAGVPKSDLRQMNYRYYSALGQIARQTEVQILMENQCGCLNGHLVRGVCADVAAASEWIDELNQKFGKEVFGFCLDTGACNLCGQDMREMTATLGTRLKAVLIRECDGIHEASRLPFTGKGMAGYDTDWQGLIRGLREIEFDGSLIMDASDTLKGFSHLIRTQVLQLIGSVADYLKWQIGMEKCIKEYPERVLFGAGNMCRQYMTFYGEQYPPLYVCDNNEKLWGTKICGLEVRPPEQLKELPENCVVIICNTYYEEIAGQLRAIGVRQMGAFSDECLPTDSHGW